MGLNPRFHPYGAGMGTLGGWHRTQSWEGGAPELFWGRHLLASDGGMGGWMG